MQKLGKLSSTLEPRIKALKALEDVANASGQKVGTYFQTMAMAGSAGALFVNPVVGIIGLIASYPPAVKSLLMAYGRLKGRTMSADIVAKVQKGEKLLPEESAEVAIAVNRQANEVVTEMQVKKQREAQATTDPQKTISKTEPSSEKTDNPTESTPTEPQTQTIQSKSGKSQATQKEPENMSQDEVLQKQSRQEEILPESEYEKPQKPVSEKGLDPSRGMIPKEGALSKESAGQKGTAIKTSEAIGSIDDIKTRPDLFQQTRRLENLEKEGFEEYKVSEIVKDFDKKKFDPIEVGVFRGSDKVTDGDAVVLSGHNRLEILKRAVKEGKISKDEALDLIKTKEYVGDEGLQGAIRESIFSNTSNKSTKDLGVLDLAINGKLGADDIKQIFSYDKTKVKFFNEIVESFKKNDLIEFWNEKIAISLSQYKNLSFKVLSERLNFINAITEKVNTRLADIPKESHIAVKNDIHNFIAESMRPSAVKTIRSVESGIKRFLDAIQNKGYSKREVQDLWGNIVTQTKVDKDKVGIFMKFMQNKNKFGGIDNETYDAVKRLVSENQEIKNMIQKEGGKIGPSTQNKKLEQKLLDMVKKRPKNSHADYESKAIEINRIANENKPEFIDDVKNIANDLGNRFASESEKFTVKTVDSILSKFQRKGYTEITDSLRATIEVEKIPKNIDEIIAKFKKLGYKVHNNDITNRFADGSVGYRDLNIKFKNKNDVIAEVQFLQPNMLFRKNKVHGLYDLQKRIEILENETGLNLSGGVKKAQNLFYDNAYKIDNKLLSLLLALISTFWIV